MPTKQPGMQPEKMSGVSEDFWHIFRLLELGRGGHPLLSQWCILIFSLISTKFINFPPYFGKILKFPLFSFNLRFLA